jgi:hypothetical protein
MSGWVEPPATRPFERDSLCFAAGTVATSDYLPWARVLAESFAAHNPHARFVVAVLDEPDPAQLRSDDRFDLVRAQDIGLTGPEYDWMTSIYNGFELSCAAKPWLLRFLISDAHAAVYLDADILVCHSLADLAHTAAETGLLLCPHTLEPPPADGMLPDDDIFLRSGQFNGGFVAVGRDSGSFLDWWRDRLTRECLAWSPAEPQRFVDQRWLDLAANYFPSAILRDRGANVAYWNLATRRLEHGPDGYTVDHEPLRFLHFSGFDPSVPHVLSKHGGEPQRVDPSGSPALRQLCAEYAQRLVEAGLQLTTAARSVAQLEPGIPLTQPIRRAVRAALIEAERTGTAPLSGPRDADALWAWLRAPVTPAGTSWYLWGLWRSQSALRGRFAQVPGPDEPAYLEWSAREGVALGLVPAGLEQPATPIELEGLRSFVVLIDASELIADPPLLAGLANSFDSADDITLVIRAGGRDAERLARDLGTLLSALGLEDADSPDMVGLVDPAGPGALAPLAHAVLTHRTVEPALAGLPHVSEAAVLRALFVASTAAESRSRQT